jgi:putative transposase
MPQIFRILPEEGVIHILTRGNNRQRVFHDDKDYKVYLNTVRQYKPENKIRFYHYCLMPNHVHLIVEITHESNLSRFMKQLNLGYMFYYKKRYSYNGHLWQGRYKSLIISRDEYLIACARYIELNPVKAGIVKNPKEYQYSSYNTYAYGENNDIINYNPIYLEWGKTSKERQLRYREDIGEGLKRLAINLNASFIGSKEFIAGMEDKFKVYNIMFHRGRPKKA